MAIFRVDNGELNQVDNTSFAAENVRERQDLQQWLRKSPGALGDDLLIVAEEFGDWEDARRRIDLLALDKAANLVVIELKRTDDGGFMDLQAVRYAAMISSMTFEDVVAAHDKYRARQGLNGSAREELLAFLGHLPDEVVEISKVPRIMLVSQDFSLEITTTVLWLVDRGIDIRCIQVRPYRIDGRLFLDIRQSLPLQDASDYQVRIRQKDENVRRTAASGKQRERTLPALARHGRIQEGTPIEIVPGALPPDAADRDPRTFRARIGDLESRASVVWDVDGQAYSPTRLTAKLSEEQGLVWLGSNTMMHWRIVGDTQSMWNRAEELTRGERFDGTTA